MQKVFLISIPIILTCLEVVNAQLEEKTGSITDLRIEKWNEIYLDSQQLQTLAAYHSPKDVAFQFAVPVEVKYLPDNSGRFYDIGNEVVWIIGIRSKYAKSLNMILEPFHIREGAYVYIYDSKKEVVRGAFTALNNNRYNILPTMPVPGDEIILEYHVPKGTNW
jgi:hypothetical protein